MSIDKDILYSMIERKVKDEDALWLSRVLIYHDCTNDYIFKGDPGYIKKIPAHKTLFNAPGNKGLPIGNLNSQFFANVYLNLLDQFVKHQLTFITGGDLRGMFSCFRWVDSLSFTVSMIKK